MEQEPFGQCDAKEICMHTHDQIHGKWSKLIQKSHNYNWYKRVVSEFINLLLNYSHTYHIFIHLPCAHQFKYLIVVQHLMLPFFFYYDIIFIWGSSYAVVHPFIYMCVLVKFIFWYFILAMMLEFYFILNQKFVTASLLGLWF